MLWEVKLLNCWCYLNRIGKNKSIFYNFDTAQNFVPSGGPHIITIIP